MKKLTSQLNRIFGDQNINLREGRRPVGDTDPEHCAYCDTVATLDDDGLCKRCAADQEDWAGKRKDSARRAANRAGGRADKTSFLDEADDLDVESDAEEVANIVAAEMGTDDADNELAGYEDMIFDAIDIVKESGNTDTRVITFWKAVSDEIVDLSNGELRINPGTLLQKYAAYAKGASKRDDETDYEKPFVPKSRYDDLDNDDDSAFLTEASETQQEIDAAILQSLGEFLMAATTSPDDPKGQALLSAIIDPVVQSTGIDKEEAEHSAFNAVRALAKKLQRGV